MQYRKIATIFMALIIAAGSLAACGSGSSNSSEGTSSSGGTSGGTSSGGSYSCEAKEGHTAYVNRNCASCHNESNKPLSYAGSAPVGMTVTIVEDTTQIRYQLPVNSQGNFCLRSKYGGAPSGGYTASASTTMIAHQSYGYCGLSGCHDGNRPIY
jgi:hypothetical protein